ncbi:MAG: enoyl-CoA hydratase/isomerase family protein [Bacteroidales bacterium]
MSSRQPIIWKVESGIGFLEFNNPPGNEMTAAFYDQLELLVSKVIPRSNVKAIIIAGSGRHFSSGADLDSLFKSITKDSYENISNPDTSHPDSLTSNLQAFHFFKQLDIPVIAAIRGVCIGAGMELALFCHFRICAEGAVLGLPETGYGLIRASVEFKTW